MSTRGFDLDLTRPTQSGVYFVGVDDLERLSKAALRDELRVCRTDLSGCHDKDELLRRLAVSLALPATFGHNWDALADCLRDLGWMPAWGYVLLFPRADELRHAAAADFNTLLGILDDASTFAAERDMPWFAFLALPDSAFAADRVAP
jgi:RNAse (barnase) inhibitor barstar